MNSKLKGTLIFVVGAAIGGTATWLFTKKYYKDIADEEIASVKEYYGKKREKTESENFPEEKIEETIPEVTEEDKDKYKQVLEKSGYTNYSNNPHRDKNNYELPSEEDNPFVSFIDDDQYGFEFEVESLDYFIGDDIMVNEHGEEMTKDEINEAIGVDWKDKFLNCGYETLYIRNTFLEKDYEVVRNDGSWKESNSYVDEE